MTSTINGRLKNWKLTGVFVFLYFIVHLPSLNDYWSRDPLTHYAPITTRRRFREISRYLHFTHWSAGYRSVRSQAVYADMGTGTQWVLQSWSRKYVGEHVVKKLTSGFTTSTLTTSSPTSSPTSMGKIFLLHWKKLPQNNYTHTHIHSHTHAKTNSHTHAKTNSHTYTHTPMQHAHSHNH